MDEPKKMVYQQRADEACTWVRLPTEREEPRLGTLLACMENDSIARSMVQRGATYGGEVQFTSHKLKK